MGKKRKYSDEFREDAVWQVYEMDREGASRKTTLPGIAEHLGCPEELLREWVFEADTDMNDRLSEIENAPKLWTFDEEEGTGTLHGVLSDGGEVTMKRVAIHDNMFHSKTDPDADLCACLEVEPGGVGHEQALYALLDHMEKFRFAYHASNGVKGKFKIWNPAVLWEGGTLGIEFFVEPLEDGNLGRRPDIAASWCLRWADFYDPPEGQYGEDGLDVKSTEEEDALCFDDDEETDKLCCEAAEEELEIEREGRRGDKEKARDLREKAASYAGRRTYLGRGGRTELPKREFLRKQRSEVESFLTDHLEVLKYADTEDHPFWRVFHRLLIRVFQNRQAFIPNTEQLAALVLSSQRLRRDHLSMKVLCRVYCKSSSRMRKALK